MSNQDTQATASVSWTGGTSGVVAPQALDDDWSPTRDAKATDSTTAIDGTLHLAAELARRLAGAHQAAASLIIRGNWQGMRKYFSLSPLKTCKPKTSLLPPNPNKTSREPIYLMGQLPKPG